MDFKEKASADFLRRFFCTILYPALDSLLYIGYNWNRSQHVIQYIVPFRRWRSRKMMMTQIVKRDGRAVDFDVEKIAGAI